MGLRVFIILIIFFYSTQARSLSLNEAIKIGTENSPEALMLKEKVSITKANRVFNYLNLLPNVSYSANYNLHNNAGSIIGGAARGGGLFAFLTNDSVFGYLSASLDVTLYSIIPGLRYESIANSKEITQHIRDLDKLKSKIAETYMLASYAKMYHDSMTASLALAKANIQKAEIAFKQKLISELEMDSYLSTLNEVEAGLINSESDLEKAQSDYERIIGSKPENLDHSFPILKLPAENIDEFEEKVSHGKDFQIMDLEYKESQYALALSSLNLLPKLSINYYNIHNALHMSAGNNYAFLASITIPLFDRGESWKKVYMAQKQLKIANIKNASDKTETLAKSRQTWRQLKALEKNIEAKQRSVKVAEMSLKKTDYERKNKIKSDVDYSSAMQKLLEKKAELLRLQKDYVVLHFYALSML